jgi:hypothetical protein
MSDVVCVFFTKKARIQEHLKKKKKYFVNKKFPVREMKTIVIIADTGWSIGLVHKDVAASLGEDYEFKFYDHTSFVVADFLNDFHSADLCMTTLWVQDGLFNMLNFKTPEEQRKFVVVCHGVSEIQPNTTWSPHVTYGTVSDILLPFCPVLMHVVPNGVNASRFQRKAHDGKITTLGWCGALRTSWKMSDRAFEIARQAKMPLSIAEALSLDDLKIWYHSIDVLLVTSGPQPHDETGPLPPFEAILSGVPVIGTSVGNFRKVPGPKFSNPEEAARILAELKKDPERVKLLAEEQYHWVMENWTYTTHAAAWKTMFDAAIASQVSK